MSGRRITVDLTGDAAAEMDRIRKESGYKVSDIMRHGFTLFRIYLESVGDGKQIHIVDPKEPGIVTRIVIPTPNG